jgi:hypothetical protein
VATAGGWRGLAWRTSKDSGSSTLSTSQLHGRFLGTRRDRDPSRGAGRAGGGCKLQPSVIREAIASPADRLYPELRAELPVTRLVADGPRSRAAASDQNAVPS